MLRAEVIWTLGKSPSYYKTECREDSQFWTIRGSFQSREDLDFGKMT